MIDNGKLRIQDKKNNTIMGEAIHKDGLYIVKAKVLENWNRLNQRETTCCAHQ